MILKDINLKNILLERGIVINYNKKIIINIKITFFYKKNWNINNPYSIYYTILYTRINDNSKSSKRNY